MNIYDLPVGTYLQHIADRTYICRIISTSTEQEDCIQAKIIHSNYKDTVHPFTLHTSFWNPISFEDLILFKLEGLI